ncbi:hypothetical protein PG994_002997 [Apiospora phragmitis]|uniref:Uncharacterized protein n=1 Tax=Apiospora phragmitis TaxID=2905665 RepID=A0ABR1W9N6_9PEZI
MNGNPDYDRSKLCESVNAGHNLEDLKLGMVIRQDKYAWVYSIVASDWAWEPCEAHVFEMRGRKQVRFLERMVWPKMRKSDNYKVDFTCASTRIFIQSDVEAIEWAGVNDTKAKLREARLLKMAAATSNDGTLDGVSNDSSKEARLNPVAFVKEVFIYHCVRMGKPLPKFEDRLFANSRGPLQLDGIFRGEGFEEHVERDFSKVLPAAIDERGKPKRGSARPLPLDRDIEMILDLAKIIESQRHLQSPGHRFYRTYLVPHEPQPEKPESSTFEELASRQKDWTGRLNRLLQRIPKILQWLTRQRAAIWKASTPTVLQVFDIVGDSENPMPNNGLDDWPHFLR